MNRVIRFSSAAVGMVFLAGLAYYQDSVDPTLGQEDALSGTVLTEAAEIDASRDLVMDETLASDCESTAGLEGAGADECAAQEHSSGTN